MWTLFKVTDIAISRAGANTIMELLSNEIPTIFIPLPKGISRGDQIDNAKYLQNLGVCRVIFQDELSSEKLQNELNFIEKQAKDIVLAIKKQNFTDGTQRIIDVINECKTKK